MAHNMDVVHGWLEWRNFEPGVQVAVSRMFQDVGACTLEQVANRRHIIRETPTFRQLPDIPQAMLHQTMEELWHECERQTDSD